MFTNLCLLGSLVNIKVFFTSYIDQKVLSMESIKVHHHFIQLNSIFNIPSYFLKF